MAWIRTLEENEVSGTLGQVYKEDMNQLGFVMEADKALSIKPALADAVEAFAGAVKQSSSLSQRERGLISLLVADRLSSTYCALVFAARVERDLGGLDRVRSVLRDFRNSGLSPREVAILDYAVAATAGHPTEAHITQLREVGLDDTAILDVAVWANLRAFRSRIYDALGIQTDPFFLEQDDLVQAVTVREKQHA